MSGLFGWEHCPRSNPGHPHQLGAYDSCSGCTRHLRAQLAQRDGELEALRGKVEQIAGLLNGRYTTAYDLISDLKDILSGNPESPALTDKEEGE